MHCGEADGEKEPAGHDMQLFLDIPFPGEYVPAGHGTFGQDEVLVHVLQPSM